LTLRIVAPLAVLAVLVSACETTDGGKRIPARFDCDDGSKLNLVFDHEKDAAVLRLPKDATVDLPSQHPGSGMWYAGGGYELRGAGDTLNFTAPDHPKTVCIQKR
jgi:membrane-bound inhibitor of C-type lysozyme